MKVLSRILAAAAVLLSDAMCAVVAYDWCALEWGGRYAGYSAPPETALALAIPFLAGIGVLAALSIVFGRKAKKDK